MFTQKNVQSILSKEAVECPTLKKDFLSALCMQRVAVTVFLVSGIKLQGNIEQFSEDCVVLTKERIVQILFLHAISSIMPVTPFSAPEYEYAG